MRVLRVLFAAAIATLLFLSTAFFTAGDATRADHADIINFSLVTRSSTGFYELDPAGGPIVDPSGIMLVFDYTVVRRSVSTRTFWVQADDGSNVDVVDLQSHENLIFLKLKNIPPSDATPTVGVSDGEYIELDLGTHVDRLFFAKVEINDGIPPTLSMTLGGGSGTGTGEEGPERLTKDKIDITVTSDEPLHEPPKVTVICNDLQWTEANGSEIARYSIEDFIANRTGQLTETQSTNPDSSDDQTPDYWCGSDDDLTLTTSTMSAVGETSWTYEWRNPTDSPSKLRDGLLKAVAHARDQSEYERHDDGDTVHNWSTSTTNFTLDTILKSPLEPGGGETTPANESAYDGDYLLILVEFAESTSVHPLNAIFDSVELLDGFEDVGDNRFLY